MLETRKFLPHRQAHPHGPSVSLIGLGCMGMSEFYGASDDQKSRELLTRAVDSGITFFDTADVYGSGHNEKLVGHALRNHPARNDLVLATKGGIVRDANDSTSRGVNTSPEYILKAIDRSLDRLQTHIDLYYLHRVEDNGRKIDETMEALAGALKTGKINAVGLSEVSAETLQQADNALRKATEDAHGIAAVQTEYSLMTRNVENNGIDAACRKLGILLVAYSPICRGLLADPDFNPENLSSDDFRRNLPRFETENLKHNRKLVQVLAETADAEGITPAQVALSWVCSRGPHIVPIPGTRSIDRLDENIRASRVELSSKTIAQIENVFSSNAAAGLRYTPTAMQAYGLTE